MGNVNFCPNCGHKVEGTPKFCPECGKTITGKPSSGLSLSDVGGGVINAYGKVSSKIKEKTDSVKANYAEKKEANTKVLSVLSVRAKDDAPEQKIGTLGKGKGTEKIEITTKAIYHYCPKRKNILQAYLDNLTKRWKKKPDEMVLASKINLKDIKQISKVLSPLNKQCSFHIITNNGTYDFDILSEPYLFSLYLFKALKFDKCIFNIDLLSGEIPQAITPAIVETYEGKVYGTLYITNQRVIFAKLGGGAFEFKSSRYLIEEGEDVVFSFGKDDLRGITTEKLKAMNCEYHIVSENKEYIVSFNKVPKAFLDLVPNAEGDQKIHKRKKTLMKAFAFVLIFVKLFGLGGDTDADAADMDMDTDDIDMDTDNLEVEVDLDGDGDVDAIGYDLDGDGDIDGMAVDCDNDGTMDSIALDADGDGTIDSVAYDTDGDGNIDEVEIDSDGEGKMDTTITDSDTQSVESSPNDDYYDLHRREMELNKEIANTHPLKREALIRERDAISQKASDALFDERLRRMGVK